ncbi:MAG: lytic murein transglycosylase [Syntrophales bacterium]
MAVTRITLAWQGIMSKYGRNHEYAAGASAPFSQRAGFFISASRPAAGNLFSLLFFVVAVFFLFLQIPASVLAEDWSPLMSRLVDDGFDRRTIQALFSRSEVVFEPDVMSNKLRELIRKRFEKPSASPSRRYRSVYESFLKPEVIAGAREYVRENRAVLDEITKNYCVPKEIVVSILLVETRLGWFLGTRKAFNTLASMALSSDLEIILPYLSSNLITPENEEFARSCCRQKSDWAYRELKALIGYAEKTGLDPLAIPGSIYGAIGLCQFMPSHAFTFGIDADGDGRIDLFATSDALHSIANYLQKHGWKCRMSKNRQHRVILSYNHCHTYANTVLSIANKLKPGIRTVKRKIHSRPA